MAGSRNFATKLWNAARFTLTQIEGKTLPGTLAGRALSLPDRWILSRLTWTCREVDRQLKAFRFDEASQAIYAFVWGELCDGYLEMVKPVASGADAEAALTARGVLVACLEGSLALLHPFMPFVTEEIWEKLTGRPGTLIVTKYPEGDAAFADSAAEAAVGAMRELVTRVRNFRTERGASPTEPVLLSIGSESASRVLLPDLEILAPHLKHLARLSELRFGAPGPGASQDVVAGLALGLQLASPTGEHGAAQLAKTIAEIEQESAGLRSKLANPSFVDKAPAPVVEKVRRRLEELEERRAALSGGAA